MRWLRLSLFVLLTAIGGALLIGLYAKRDQPALGISPLFLWGGKTTPEQARRLTRLVDVDNLDELELGEVIPLRFKQASTEDPASLAYLDSILQGLGRYTRKSLPYRALLIAALPPNAMALPGGRIVVTQELLAALDSESELAALLAHEMGHVALGHCLLAVKPKVRERGQSFPMGEIADLTFAVLLRHVFTRAQEDEADDFAFGLLAQTRYDPSSLPDALQSLQRHESPERTRERDLLRGYLEAHPPQSPRIVRLAERARAFWSAHRGERRYVGKRNLQQKTSLFTGSQYADEWIEHLD